MGTEQSRNGNGAAPGGTAAVPPGMTTLGPNLQKRFARGIQYNMKVVIKGDRNVGKTCLFHRLQGRPFKEEYIPTQEIQVACIQWNYKVTDDIVKVEIWDIVDKGKVKKREGLKLDTEDTAPTLDAEFIDVYKGTSGVIIMLDITKYWTYEYVQQELRKVPLDIPVIVMASHRDMEDKRAVLTEEVQSFITDELNRPPDAAAVYYMEASMTDGFGLKYLYRFFNVPFLELQRQTLQAQLRRNEEDLQAIKVELELHEKSEEQDYERFKEFLERKRKGLPMTGLCTVAAGANEAISESPSDLHSTQQGGITGEVTQLQDGAAMSLRSRLSQQVLQSAPLPAKLNPTNSNHTNKIENFVPEGTLDSTFLSESRDPSPRPSRAKMGDVQISDSEEEECHNPQVTLDQESPDEGDMVVVYKEEGLHGNGEEGLHGNGGVYKEEGLLTMADEDISEPPPTEIEQAQIKEPEVGSRPGPAPSRPGPVIHLDPAPPLHIDPTGQSAGRSEPLSGDVMVTRESGDGMVTRASDDVIVTRDSDDATPDKDMTMISEPPSPAPALAPSFDLDILEKISYAPPIEIKKSPKTKRSSPRSTKKESKKPAPKKSLLDIILTSSEEEDETVPVAVESDGADPAVQILATYEEPHPARSARVGQVKSVNEEPAPQSTIRQGSSGSLKLTHVEPIVTVPEPVIQQPVKKEKKKKREKTVSISAEESRKKKEKDELAHFFGEPAVEETTLPRKKKTKKKKPKKLTAADGDEYEQF